ncbi:winged helix-turn-helix domain-containing protein [Pseudorhodobacter sp. E13]|uniref:winged helix-turn-helix domain-containing protein n=1 Tax=Pseudorhodobacter sp. E13 TaxID=2487931 RepID=UPI000F8C50CA|nr:crosslink repair DNA glycosylase YcaQ family protein [Pseudorhodobacter sp. E13]RUS60169.1 winged helix-turn-helix domain-containing protein [Pseudorhodobacter sp. E13]
MTPQTLSNSLARRLFLHRHALGDAPTGPGKGEDLAGLIDRIGFVQVDSIRTVARAHDMILFSRRQAYRPKALKDLLERDRALFEHWTHDASIIPVHQFPQWQHRFDRDAARLRNGWKRWFRDGYEAQFDTILRRIEAEGPVTCSDVGEGEARGKGGWWDWHPSKTALEWLWRTGVLSITRRENFQKVYDLTERVIPAAHLDAPVEKAAHLDWACRAALDRLGFATAGELAAYWAAVPNAEARDWCAAALRRGEIIEIAVEAADGSQRRSFARPDVVTEAANLPPAPARLRVLSPFDPALRDRARAERLFGFFYRIEVFVPEAKRQYGYYVFPVLEGERLIGRVDAKAFRDESCLRVTAFWPEAGVRMGPGRVARLEAALGKLARFAECDRVAFADDWLRDG